MITLNISPSTSKMDFSKFNFIDQDKNTQTINPSLLRQENFQQLMSVFDQFNN
ncbi:hypothetical protein ACU5EH_03435 [Aliivibrio salmonicida]|uniref:hypothetical protein n=1 Tax=Aliivibrio salmonicida TaxID=40269 RepID=UPI00406C105A